MIFRFTPNLIDKFPESFDLIQKSYLRSTVTYIIDWRYRKATNLVPWLEKQVINPSPVVQAFADKIASGNNYDETVLNILTEVKKKIIYKGDTQNWKVEEYWATAEETLTGTSVVDGTTYGPMDGDCEDGAILIYVLARLKGVPINRLMIIAGDVAGGGHCWCAYRPAEYPLNWVFLDWCYWASLKDMNNRNMYYINNKSIFGWKRTGTEVDGNDLNYKELWFGFNESSGHYSLNFSFKYRDLK